MLRNQNVLQYVLERAAFNSDQYTSYCSAEIFRQNELFSSEKVSLQIGLYHDEFEVANPLGTSKGVYKLSVFYWTVGNLPQDLKSSIDHIQLAVFLQIEYCKSLWY